MPTDQNFIIPSHRKILGPPLGITKQNIKKQLFLIQRLSRIIQRLNAVAFCNTLATLALTKPSAKTSHSITKPSNLHYPEVSYVWAETWRRVWGTKKFRGSNFRMTFLGNIFHFKAENF